MAEKYEDTQQMELSSLKTKWFELRSKRMAELITVLLLMITGVNAYALWVHMEQTKETGMAQVAVMKELVMSQRETTCTFRAPQEQRDTADNIAKCRWEAQRP